MASPPIKFLIAAQTAGARIRNRYKGTKEAAWETVKNPCLCQFQFPDKIDYDLDSTRNFSYIKDYPLRLLARAQDAGADVTQLKTIMGWK